MAQPEKHDAIDAAAQILALDVPEACRQGIAQNLLLLRMHLQIVETSPPEDGPAA